VKNPPAYSKVAVSGTPYTTFPSATPKFKRHRAENEREKHQHQGKIEAAEYGCIGKGKSREERPAGGEKPYFVTVPHGADRTDECRSFFIIVCYERKQYSHPEIEPV
jgi:hypothetical protein